jgi:hypothetical protein
MLACQVQNAKSRLHQSILLNRRAPLMSDIVVSDRLVCILSPAYDKSGLVSFSGTFGGFWPKWADVLGPRVVVN